MISAHIMGQEHETPDKLQPLHLKSGRRAKLKVYTTKDIYEITRRMFEASRDLDQALTDAGIRKLTESALQGQSGQDD